MVEGNLDTTNLLLGILAAVSVLEALLLLGIGFMAWKLYGQTMQTVREIEQRQIAPLVTKVNTLMGTVDGILVDVKGITSRVGAQTERVNSAISTTIDRVDETADRVKHSLAFRVNRVLGLVSGVRAAVGSVMNGGQRSIVRSP
jgi:methyl-accepting chemotaxis protein